MALTLIGISHHTAPVELREKLSFRDEDLKTALSGLRAEGEEAVLLSTCNRTELYFHSPHPSHKERALKFFQEHSAGQALEPHLYMKEGQEAVQHLFSVAAGLESLVYGEQEIQKQVKDAYCSAHYWRLTAKLFNVLFQRALYVGKLVRTHTGIARGSLSVASVAVSLAEKIFGDLTESNVLIFGAGNMAELAARHLLSKKIKKLYVANRTFENARILADQFQGEPLRLEEGLQKIAAVDIVITSIFSDQPILTRENMKAVMTARGNRSLFVIDIAVPRNVETSVSSLDNLYLYNIDDLQGIAGENLKSRGGEIEKARSIVSLKASEFFEWVKSMEEGDEKSLKHSSETLRDSMADL